MPGEIHQGKNVKRFRELLGMKQIYFAAALGKGWTQKKISQLEGKEIIQPALREQIARILTLPPKAITHFDEAAFVALVAHAFRDPATLHGELYTPVIDLVNRCVVAMEENKKLYTALLQEKDEKIALLEKIVANRK